jgi:uncharacterized protein
MFFHDSRRSSGRRGKLAPARRNSFVARLRDIMNEQLAESTALGTVESELLGKSNYLDAFFSFLTDPELLTWNRHCLSFVTANYKPVDPAHGIDHLLRVLRTAFRIADCHTGIDRCVLLISCYFHDYLSFSKSVGLSEISSRVTADHVEQIFGTGLLSTRQLQKLHNAILCHSYSAETHGDSAESDILYDADKIDALGAIGVARLFCVAGAIKSNIYDFADPFFEFRSPDDKQFAIDHFYKKILLLPDKMRTSEGRRIATQKIRIVEQFLGQLRADI